MAKRHKKNLTLLEVMVALSLCAILLGCLFHYYQRLSLVNIQVEKVKESVASRQRAQLFLAHLFLKVATAVDDEKESPCALFTEKYAKAEGPALFIRQCDALGSDPEFCGDLTHILYLSNKRLCCTTESKSGSTREAVLLENVLSLEFEFFDAAEKEKTWTPTWEKNSSSLPIMARVKLMSKEAPKEPLIFSCFLPPTALPITYKEGL